MQSKMGTTEKGVTVEVLLEPPTKTPTILQTQELFLLHSTIATILQSKNISTSTLPIPKPLSDLRIPTTGRPLSISRIHATVCEDDVQKNMPFWCTKHVIHLYTYSPVVYTPPPGAFATALPCASLVDRWEGLHFCTPLKSVILSYMTARHAHPSLPSSGLILLHGPPGTGKSSLAVGAAQKICVRLGQGVLVRLTHESLSKYFGESANRVCGVFNWALQQKCVVVIVIDEIESFGMCRTSTNAGDNVRVTNALITGLDLVKDHHTIFVMGTSNSVENVDAAVADRADVMISVSVDAVCKGVLLQGCLERLVSCGILKSVGNLVRVSEILDGVGGRRIEGCVILAVGICDGFSIEWDVFEKALIKAALIARGRWEDVV